jgi:BASS family bile acid:Na+ symporter
MTADRIIGILALVTLVEMMVYVGLGTTVGEFRRAATDGWLVGRALLANYVLVPAVTVGLLVLFRPEPMVAVGFLILAVCPGGPYGPPCTAIAKGNVGTAAGLMVILVASSALLSPVLLAELVRPVTGGRPLDVDVTRITVTLLLGQVLPLGGGMAMKHWRPHVAERLHKPAFVGAKVLNAALFTLVIAAHYDLILAIKVRGWVGMLALLVASVLIGWACGGGGGAGGGGGDRKAVALTTAVRNKGVGMVIATGAFAGTPAITSVLIYGLFSFLVSLLVASWWGRRGPRPDAPAPSVAPVAVGTGG